MQKVIIFVILLVLPNFVFAESNSLFGYNLGMTYTEYKKQNRKERLGYGYLTEMGNKTEKKFGDIKLAIFVQFKNKKARCILVKFKPENYKLILDALSQKYMNDGKRKKEQIKTKIGVEYEQVKASWDLKNGDKTLFFKYNGNIKEGLVMLMSKEYIDSKKTKNNESKNEIANQI